MSETILRREAVAQGLAIAPETLVHYERLGFIHCVEQAGVVGYPPAEIRRIWSILSYQRDLGVNLAGVELILKLRDLVEVHRRQLVSVAAALEAALDEAERDG
jgi:MerR family transcriptional regulator/heat shock protein HspR